MMKIICLRHGQSQWNLENKFTGWTDVAITEKGKQQAQDAGMKLADMKIDAAYVSELQRAKETLRIALDAAKINVPVHRDKALNERHYGRLQGMHKDEVMKEFGEEQFHKWRRGYDDKPPDGESLKDVVGRVSKYFNEQILPELKKGKVVLIVAHGNSLRALAMHIENLSENEITKLEIPLCEPLIYEMDENGKVLLKEYI